MIKIVKINGTQLSNKPSILSEINEKGFLFVSDEGEEMELSFDTIKDYFLDKIVKIKIEEISRAIVD
jgi:hypothetical protein